MVKLRKASAARRVARCFNCNKFRILFVNNLLRVSQKRSACELLRPCLCLTASCTPIASVARLKDTYRGHSRLAGKLFPIWRG